MSRLLPPLVLPAPLGPCVRPRTPAPSRCLVTPGVHSQDPALLCLYPLSRTVARVGRGCLGSPHPTWTGSRHIGPQAGDPL